MGLFDKLKGPVFIKEGSSAQNQINELKIILENAESFIISCPLSTEL